MKLPLILTLVILVAGSLWGWRENQHLTVLREQHRQVLEEVASLGIPADSSQPSAPTRSSVRQKEASRLKTKEFADRLVTFAKEMKEIEKSGKQPDEAAQKRIMDLMDGMASLNGEELQMLVGELKDRTDLDDEMKKNMIGFSIMMLAQQHPEAALAMFTESSDLMKGNFMSRVALRSALTQWAKDQPLAAMEWIKKNAEKFPDLANDEAKMAVVIGAAQQDFGVSFRMLSELKPSDHSPFWQIAQAANTPEKQTAYLEALRTQVQNISDKAAADKFREQGMGSLLSQVFNSGYDTASTWLKNANLSPQEIDQATSNLSYHQTKEDSGKWLDWLSTQTIDTKNTNGITSTLVRDWTQNDYKAAGEWLAGTPASPVKEAATMAYLQTVAPYDPDSAVMWANTLPANKQKNALQRIYESLENKDKGAAEIFARKHGLGGQ